MSNIYIEKKTKTKMFIFFLPTSGLSSSVGIDVVKKFSKLVLIFGCNEGVLISEKPLTSTSKGILEYSNITGETTERNIKSLTMLVNFVLLILATLLCIHQI